MLSYFYKRLTGTTMTRLSFFQVKFFTLLFELLLAEFYYWLTPTDQFISSMSIAGAANPNLFNLFIIPGVICDISCLGTSRSFSLSLQGSITSMGTWSFFPMLILESALTRSYPALGKFYPNPDFKILPSTPLQLFSSSFFQSDMPEYDFCTNFLEFYCFSSS